MYDNKNYFCGKIILEIINMEKPFFITQPDDWHLHLREGEMLATTVPASARVFARAIVMPNLSSPIVTIDQAKNYKQNIIKHIPASSNFTPLMTLYLTDNIKQQDIITGKTEDIIFACKLYPQGATTNSEFGVTNINKMYPLFAIMERYQIPLLIHAEVNDDKIDIFDRELAFIDKHLIDIINNFPELKIVMEHITTVDAVEFIKEQNHNVAATITAHHLLYNRNHMLAGGIKPHYYCLPILKRSTHQQALIDIATSGHNRFFLGTDSAPHQLDKKQSCCGCAGCFTAPFALELYTEVFAKENKIGQLEKFASLNGADFYGIPRNTAKVKITKKSWQMPDFLDYDNEKFKLLGANETWNWSANIEHH
jgi:dihydroorotase